MILISQYKKSQNYNKNNFETLILIYLEFIQLLFQLF